MSDGPPPTRRKYDAREVVSALQKSIRRSDPDAALYWGVELARSGYGNWLWKRLRIIVCEDVSPEATGLVADLHALNVMWEAEQKRQGRGGAGLLYVCRALIALAIAPKNRVADWGMMLHISDRIERRDVPDYALDIHTQRGRAMGRGWQHFVDESGRLDKWTGDLEELSAEYRDRWLKGGGADRTGLSGEPTRLPTMAKSAEAMRNHLERTGEPPGQLRIEDDG